MAIIFVAPIVHFCVTMLLSHSAAEQCGSEVK